MFKVNLDISSLQDLLELGAVADDEIRKAASDLTVMVRGKIVELANEKLHTRRKPFIDALTHFQIDESTWCVNLDASAKWIDDGMEEHDMKPGMLKSPKAKRAKDGSTYLVVPFELNKSKQSMPPAQQSLLATVKKEMAKVGATPGGIENYASGKPKLGLVRSMDIMKSPISGAGGLRIGRGPRGQVAQGMTGIPILKGIRVMQHMGEGGKVKRSVLTFRVVSSKQDASRWHHPGLDATDLMAKGLEWSLEQWSSKIVPALMQRITAKLG